LFTRQANFGPQKFKIIFFLYTFFILGGDVAKLLRFCGFVNIFFALF